MEKRAILAFVLSIVVIVAWEFFLAPDRNMKKPVVKPQQTQQAEKSPSSGAGKPSGTEKPAPNTELESITPDQIPIREQASQAADYQLWTVDSPLVEATLSGAGARFEHLRLKKYRTAVERTAPLMEMVSTQESGYLPLAVDLLHHPDWQISTRPFTSSDPEHTSIETRGEREALTLSTKVPDQVQITKKLLFSADNYAIDLEVSLKNLAKEPLEDQLGLSFYYQPLGGSKETSYNKSKLTVYHGDSEDDFDAKKIAKKSPVFAPPLEWAGYQNNYFLQAIVPLGEKDYQIIPRVVDEQSGLIQVVFLTDPFHLESGQTKDYKLSLYLGPKDSRYLKLAGHDLSKAVNFGWFTFLAKPLLALLKWLYKYTHNYGIAIIVLTIIIKILFWPLTHKSYKSMQGMKKLQPKMAELKEKYKDDREKLNQELMMLYRTYKVNPLGGCLPMVLQIPVFFALYRMLYAAIEIRHQPFWLWINDLTAPDRLNIGVHIPYLGGLPVLTLLMGVSMFVQQKMTPTPGDPRQEKMMLMMPVVFTVFFINFPSGLVLYWLVNNVLSIVQQYMINRQTA